MRFFARAFDSRYGWFLRGLPSFARASAMFLARPYTMTSPGRCRVLWRLAREVETRGVSGAFVECGVWRGGSAAIMALAARAAGRVRPLHLFDSFEGLPEPGAEDGPEAAAYSLGRSSGGLRSINECVAGVAEVERVMFEVIRLPTDSVIFHPGWFQETVPLAAPAIKEIALLRLDGDWFASTATCLEHLYPLLAAGGFVVMDDYYAWQGCSKATDDYRARHGITAPLHRIDEAAAYWQRL